MSLEESIEPVTSLKTKPAALQGVAEYEQQRQALLLLRILAQGEEDYRSGRVHGHEQAKVHFARKLRVLARRTKNV